MKTNLLNRIFPLVLLALLNVFSSAAFSNSSAVSNLDPRDYDYLQADQNTEALFFEEISVGSYFQLEPEDLSGSSGFSPGILQNTLLHKKGQNHSNTWVYLPDFRALIENQIFPFHFFW